MVDQSLTGLLQLNTSNMNDEDKAVNEPVEETGVENATTETEAQATEPQEVSTETKVEEEQNINNSPEEEPKKKETRGSRRISDLIGKLKAKDEQVQPDPFQRPEPLIRPEEYELGIDPQEIERRQRNREFILAQQIKKEVFEESKFRDTVNDFASDLDRVSEITKDDPELDDLVAEQFDLANHTYHPTTGERMFIPRVKASEIYDKLKKVIEKKSVRAQAETTVKLREMSQDSVVAPSGKSEFVDDDDSDAIRDAMQDGSEEKWAQIIKKRLFK